MRKFCLGPCRGFLPIACLFVIHISLSKVTILDERHDLVSTSVGYTMSKTDLTWPDL